MYLVYVKAKSGKPLMPTKRFGRVKGLLKTRQAKIVNYKPFTIQLEYDSLEGTQPLTLGIDTGTEHIGVSVTKENGEPVLLAELETRNKQITDNVSTRKTHRHTRQNHKRSKKKRRARKSGTVFEQKEYLIRGYEKPIICKLIKPDRIKFENRIRAEKWLTPTCTHLLITHKNFISKIAQFLPITNVVVEYAGFDLHKLSDPDVTGKKYQEGRKKGSTNTNNYVLCRDKHLCQICKKKTGQLEVHHVIWRTNGGSDTPENLITLCDKCHKKAHSKLRFNDKIVDKFKGLKKRFNHPSILNSIMPRFYEWLEDNFSTVSKTYGYETKDKRREFGLEKEHWIDAYLIGIQDSKPNLNTRNLFQFKQFRRHNKANIIRQEDRKYYLNKTKVANNRKKRTGQTLDSLKDYIKKGGKADNLTVKPAIRPKKKKQIFNMGDIVLYKGKRYVIKGGAGYYVGFVNHKEYNKKIKNTVLLTRNQGICCL